MNLFSLPDELASHETFERLAGGDRVVVERIVSTGQFTPPGEWLAGKVDEWVVVLQGEAELSFAGGERRTLTPGDDALIPAGTQHRVERTSVEPPCIWLAVHAPGLSR